MNARRLLYTSTGALQPPWRIVVFGGATLLALLASTALVGPLVSGLFSLLDLRVSNEYAVVAAGLLGGTAIALRVDKRSWRAVWLETRAARPSLVIMGFLVGALSIGVPIVVLVATGWLDLAPGAAGSWTGAALRITLVLLPAALVEELMTRGYVLSVLRDWWGWGWAVAVTSIGFGLLHLTNNGATAGSIGLVTLAGFFLAAVLYATRSLYAAWMAHFAWNWVMAVVFHAAVSGTPFEAPGYRYVDAGPDWATGGEWGPEGGLPAAMGMIGGMGWLLRRRKRAPAAAPMPDIETRDLENA